VLGGNGATPASGRGRLPWARRGGRPLAPAAVAEPPAVVAEPPAVVAEPPAVVAGPPAAPLAAPEPRIPAPASPAAPPASPVPPSASPVDPGPAGQPTGRGPARMPVPPLLVDLAGWGWRLLLLGVVGVLLLRVAQELYLVSLPVAASLLLTALLSPLVSALRRRGVPRGAATAVAVVGMLGVLVLLLTWVVRRAVAEFPSLAGRTQQAVEELPISNDNLVRLRNQVVASIQSGRGTLAQGVLTGVQTAVEAVTGILLTLLLTVILLADGDRMWAWLVARLPPAARPRAQRAATPAWARLSGWVRGTIVIATFHALVVAATLLVLHVPLVAPLAVIVFLGSFIPLVGAILSGAVAGLVTFATQGLTPLIVLVVVLVIDNQIEAHVLQPFLVGRYVRLHPFVVALVITAGALLAGLAGALLAVPLTAALYAALTNLPDPPRARARRGARPRPRLPGRVVG
jgi:putative heme transporter